MVILDWDQAVALLARLIGLDDHWLLAADGYPTAMRSIVEAAPERLRWEAMIASTDEIVSIVDSAAELDDLTADGDVSVILSIPKRLMPKTTLTAVMATSANLAPGYAAETLNILAPTLADAPAILLRALEQAAPVTAIALLEAAEQEIRDEEGGEG